MGLSQGGKYIVGGFIVLLFIVIIVAAANSRPSTGSSTQYRPDPKYKVTLTADTVGLECIIVTNENIPADKTVLPTKLPFTMNFAKDDLLTFTVVCKDGYVFDTWDLGDNTFRSDNPMAVKPNANFVIHASIISESAVPWNVIQ